MEAREDVMEEAVKMDVGLGLVGVQATQLPQERRLL
jgi:hypothetical protein